MIKILKQFLIIMAFWGLGVGVSSLIGGLVPASILGMLFLFTALASGILKEKMVNKVSKLLIKYMVLFFLPASVGIMVAWDFIEHNIWAIVVSVVLSTVLVISVVGLLQQKIGKKC